MHGALTRYRVMAFVVGTALVVLVFVAIPIQYWAGKSGVAEVVAPIHGYLYLVYLVAAADLARRAHWGLGRILLVVAAGFVPFLAFIVEHHVYQQMQAEWAAEAAEAAEPGGATEATEATEAGGAFGGAIGGGSRRATPGPGAGITAPGGEPGSDDHDGRAG
jgi:integral membrane protein